MDVCEINNSCGSDGTQFKGIFMRNFYYLYQITKDKNYKHFIIKNADSIWLNDRGYDSELGGLYE